jgi:hypothetical protein
MTPKQMVIARRAKLRLAALNYAEAVMRDGNRTKAINSLFRCAESYSEAVRLVRYEHADRVRRTKAWKARPIDLDKRRGEL